MIIIIINNNIILSLVVYIGVWDLVWLVFPYILFKIISLTSPGHILLFNVMKCLDVFIFNINVESINPTKSKHTINK